MRPYRVRQTRSTTLWAGSSAADPTRHSTSGERLGCGLRSLYCMCCGLSRLSVVELVARPGTPMSSRAVCHLLFVLSCVSQPARAARTVTVVVDKRGSIRIPVSTLRQIGVKPDRSGSVWIQFPLPAAERPRVRPPLSPRIRQTIPPRLLVAVDKGQVIFSRTRIGMKSHVPGAPGTKYLASGSGNEVVLRVP